MLSGEGRFSSPEEGLTIGTSTVEPPNKGQVGTSTNIHYSDRRWLFLNSDHTNHAHLCVVGGVFLLESVIRYAVLVRYSEFRGCPLFGSSKCIMGIAVGTSTVVSFLDEVRYWGEYVIGGFTLRCVRCSSSTTQDHTWSW